VNLFRFIDAQRPATVALLRRLLSLRLLRLPEIQAAAKRSREDTTPTAKICEPSKSRQTYGSQESMPS